jgi:predicted kinase
VVAIPGATRPETARSAARAAGLRVAPSPVSPAPRTAPAQADTDVVLVMGIPGAGKTRVAEEYVARGYLRLNRDERGGTLRELAGALDETLASGARRVVLDNTYLSRASRSYVLEAADKHGAPVRCLWLDTPLAQAQVNLVERLLERFGSLPAPEELKAAARREAGVHAPTSQMRALRELEPPSEDEGFAGVEAVAFERMPTSGRAGVFVAAAALRAGWKPDGDSTAPHLVFDWNPDGTEDALAAEAAGLVGAVSGPVETALCAHGGGAPVCWCRPPLPGLPLVFARAQGVDPARSLLVGTSPAHRTLATAFGARYEGVP